MKDYKESGTQGIGLIPHSWNSKQLGIFFSENRRANSYLQSVTALQFKYGEIIQKPSNGRDLSDKDKELLSKYTVIEPGDVVVNGLNLNFDLKSLRIAIARENGIITSAYIVLRPRKGVNSEYYNYVLKALDFQKILHGMGEGIRLTLSYEELKKLNVPAPDAAIQAAIVSYLDEKCGEIDSLIGLQEHMIEKLKAYKQSFITEAVTKGLNPNAKLVPTGIDWIEEIPEGWEVIKTKYIADKIFKGNGITKEEVFIDGDIPCVRYGEIYSKYTQAFKTCFSATNLDIQKSPQYFHYGDILCAGTGELVEEIGKSIVYLGDQECLAGGDIIVIRHHQDPSFLNYALNSNYAQTQKSRGKAKLKVVHISAFEIGSTYILLPPLSEQKTIASYLNEKCADIDRLIEIKQQKIEKLKDYKKSVIYEAVTGKIDII